MNRRFILAGVVTASGAGLASQLVPGILRGFLGPGPNTPVAPAPTPIRSVMPAPFGSLSVAAVPLGAGGFVTGLDISGDGKRFVCRIDVCNAYIRNQGKRAWLPLFSPATMRREDYDPLPAPNGKADGNGCSGIRMAPSNADVIYAGYRGYVWKSSDGGRTISRTGLAQKVMQANSGWQRLFNRTIDVHPTDPDRVLVGTWGDGAWYSNNGGTRWTQVQLPAADESLDKHPGVHLVLFDPEKPDNIYVFVTGVGLCASSTGLTGPFALVPGGPKHCSSLVAGTKGTVFVCEHRGGVGGLLWRYAPATGWAPSKPPREILTLAVDPRNPLHVLGADPDGKVMLSSDAGTNWNSVRGQWSREGGEIGWIGDLTTMFPAQVLFDPRAPDTAWIAQGVGVCKATSFAGPYRRTDWSAGIESLVACSALSVPGGKTILAAWDKPFWRLDDLAHYANSFRYPRQPTQPHSMDVVAQGTYLDYAGDDPKLLVGVVSPNAASGPGYSPDGGENWYVFEGEPPKGWGYAGCIAASTKTNFILLPSNNGFGAYTLDGGKSWDTIKLDGVHETDDFANAYYVMRKNVAADKTRPGVFALVYTVMTANTYDNPLGGLWLTTDGGKTWVQKLKGLISEIDHTPLANGPMQDPRQFWQCKIAYVPGFSRELIYTPHTDAPQDRLWWSTDDGVHWRELHTSIRNVVSFGFGKAAPSQSRPAFYFWGEVKGILGLYVSLDWLATPPVLLTRFPSQALPYVIWVEGDVNRFGRAYVGTNGAGWVSVEFGS